MKFIIDNKELYVTEIFIDDVETEGLIYGRKDIIFPTNCFLIEIQDIDFNVRVFLISKDYDFQGMLVFREPNTRPYSINLQYFSNFSKVKGFMEVSAIMNRESVSWLSMKQFIKLKEKLRDYLLS